MRFVLSGRPFGAVYTHPPRPAKKKPVAVPKTGKPCLAYLAGRCTFGSLCHNEHPSDAECELVLAEYVPSLKLCIVVF